MHTEQRKQKKKMNRIDDLAMHSEPVYCLIIYTRLLVLLAFFLETWAFPEGECNSRANYFLILSAIPFMLHSWLGLKKFLVFVLFMFMGEVWYLFMGTCELWCIPAMVALDWVLFMFGFFILVARIKRNKV